MANEWIIFAPAGGLLVASALGAWGYCIAVHASDMKDWRTRRKSLEADQIMLFAKKPSDIDLALMEARIRAHEVTRPDRPWWWVFPD